MGSICLILAFCNLIFYLRFWRMHTRLKEYYWTHPPAGQTSHVNYIAHRSLFFVTEIPWGKEEARFQEERNKTLLDFDEEKGKAFIRSERNLAKCEWIFLLLCFVFLFFR